MTTPRRKGAARRSDIPPHVLEALNQGREETVTLVEWLAIDMPTLLSSILPQVGLADAADDLVAASHLLANEGVTKRLKGIGAALHEATQGRPGRSATFNAMVGHTSDMVRAWAAFMLTADRDMRPKERLASARRFAVDGSVAVRECAWDSFRPYVAADLNGAIALLEPWVGGGGPLVRRCAVEATRPRGVWTPHIEKLKEDPGLGLPVLEPVRSDPSNYVQRSVANWLNDASKSRPEWTRDVCDRWLSESRTKETAWTVNRALRTVRKTQKARAS